ncbi:Asparagine synthase (glutamine-hydrolyzing) [Halanaeroarchaeum sp. HSR-CO]|uniref:asparagine synthase C-terminal domain-containing protein n=1 Tax=Halanaeroarchaeum sp. HSR-CO TaxID=2866382 RepID=UPI0037C09930|nr:Asparagine synthase (glutamine-hydrolyzing) [Halanaeroarchaeum sp. HSR-CO]
MIRGAEPSTVLRALASSNPFPGGRGFAGQLPDGPLVRDVLGRVPLSTEGPPETWSPGDDWAFDPMSLEDAHLVAAGSVVDDDGIADQWTLPDPDPIPPDEALAGLRAALESALVRVDTEGLAIAFSGGVDSALLASILEAPLYTVGFPESHDLETARAVAEKLGLDLTVRALSLDELESVVPRVARSIDGTNAMDVQIAIPLAFVGEAAADDGFDRLALGQGADELFGGYAKIEAVDHRVAATTIRGARWEVLAAMSPGLARDTLAVRATGIEPIFPFLDDAVVEAALALPSSLIVDDGVRKRALRAVATDYLPGSVANRDKKAMQYGSLVARELDRLARQAGFKRRMDDHVSQYVRARVGDHSQNL